MNRELPDPGKHTGKCFQNAANVIESVHVGWVESCDHGIESRLLCRTERFIEARDIGIRERVVVQRCITLEVIGRREVTGVCVRPLLLKRNTEQGRATDTVPHNREELTDVDPLLDVIGQVKMRVVEFRGGLRSLPEKKDGRGERDDSETDQRGGKGSLEVRTSHSKLLSHERHRGVGEQTRRQWRMDAKKLQHASCRNRGLRAASSAPLSSEISAEARRIGDSARAERERILSSHRRRGQAFPVNSLENTCKYPMEITLRKASLSGIV